MYSNDAIQTKFTTLEASEAYKEVLLLEHQPDEDPQHAATRDHNDRTGTEYAALAGMDTGANQLYGLAGQRLLNRLFQYAG